jgi:hypothetical protein
MPPKQCYHCKQWIDEGQDHDCWTTTEAALTRDLPEDLLDAWERLRETAAEFGDQRIYASHHCIMFSRKACYFFVRPKSKYLELCVFLHRPIKSAAVTRVVKSSKTKYAHLIRIQHRDEVEAPITDWLQEAYGREDQPRPAARPRASAGARTRRSRRPARTARRRPRR